MSDFGSPVVDPAGYNPVQKLSQMLQVKSQTQALQGQAAEVQMVKQTASQRSGIAGFMAHFDPTKHIGPDGTLDLDQVLTDPNLRQAAGDQFPEVMQQMIAVKQGQLTAKQSLVNLNTTNRDNLRTILGGLRTDPAVVKGTPEGVQKVQQAIGEFSAQGPDEARAGQLFGAALQNLPPDKIGQWVSNSQLMAEDASAQASHQAPTYASTGNALVNTNPQAAATPPIPVGSAPQYVMDPVTHNWVVAPAIAPRGGAAPTAAPSATAAPPAPGATPAKTGTGGLPHYAPGEAATIAANTESGGQRYNQLVNAAAESPARVNVLDNIIRLAPETRLGPGSGWKAAAETAIGQTPGFSGAKDDAAKFNELTKFLHQNALRSWQAAGGTGTDSQLHTIEGANPNTSMDPTTVVQLAKFAKAGELAMQAKATAHQAWLHQPGNNFANQSDFENQWRQNFDPVLFQLKTASAGEAKKLLDGLPQSQLNSLGKKQAWLQSEGVY